jgi:hypothetical protein
VSEDYCEGCTPMDEFSIQINELINNEVLSRTEQVSKDLEHYKKRTNELAKQLLEERQKVAGFDHKLKLALVEKAKEVTREFFGGFTVGDKVYYKAYESERKTCETCQGNKKISVQINGSDKQISCPDCNGYGAVGKSRCVPKEDKIRTARCEVSDRNKWVTYYLHRKEYEEKEVYETLEECQAACDEVNSKM